MKERKAVRSCNLIKSASPPTAHQADTLRCAIMGLFNGCSQRQLHSLMHSLIKSRYKVGAHRYNCLHKLCICTRREYIWSSLLSRSKKSNSTIHESADRANERRDFLTPPSKPQYAVLSKDSHDGKNGTESGDSARKFASDKKNSETDQKLGSSDAKDSSQYSQTCVDAQGNEEEKGRDWSKSPGDGTNNTVNQNPSVNAKCDSNQRPAHSAVADDTRTSSTGEQGNDHVQMESHAQANDVNGTGHHHDESEVDKTVTDSKVQKGKSPNILLEKAKNLLRKSSKSDDQSQGEASGVGSTTSTTDAPPPPRRRQSVDLNRCSTERNFITPVRAMTDFLLKPSDLEGLRKTKRRSPYENDPPITVYWRKDVEAKAIDVWGSKENLLKEILKRDIERRRYQQNIFTVKRRLRDYRREQGRETEFNSEQNGLLGSTGKVVLTAIFINGGNFLCKFGAWWYTGSHSMFSEALHSLADTVNQLILAYGIYKSVQRADSDHPYGYTNMRYVSSLISGVAIFCLGSGLSFYHGIIGLSDPNPVESYYWAFLVLGGSLASEGATLLVALNSVRQGAKTAQMNVTEYILRGNDPSVNVILLEDAAAVLGVLLAGSSMGLSAVYNSRVPDAIGSLLVSGLLAAVATFIIYTNVAALVGRSIPQERLDKINAELESDVMIRAIHDVKGIDMGNSLVRYKAEMDFDGGELTRSYLDKQDLNQMLEEVKKFKTIDELEEFMLKHGENIVDMMGGEIDRIELKLRKKHPEIRHCDLEIL